MRLISFCIFVYTTELKDRQGQEMKFLISPRA